MESISTKQELSIYHLEGKWYDYVGVQKEVISVLKKVNYFENKDIINHETGMLIRLTPKGIKETIGKGKRFQNLPGVVKQQKIATLRKLPILIREGRLQENDVSNYYSEAGERFAYFVCSVIIDNEVHQVRIAVKKKANANHFYIHHIDTEKSSELLSPSKKTDSYETQNL